MELATAYCQRVDACHAVLHVTLGGPDCAAAYAAACVERWSAEDVEMTAAQAQACVEATNIGQAACGDVVRFAAGQLQAPECFIPGQRGDGAVCLADEQCSGGKCLAGDPETTPPGCGVCSTVVGAAMPCGNGIGCQAGLRCAGGLCTALGAVADACGSNTHCFADLRCAASNAHRASRWASPVRLTRRRKTACRRRWASAACAPTGAGVEGETAARGSSPRPSARLASSVAAASCGQCVAQGAETEPCPSQNVVSGAACTYPAQCIAGTCLTPQAETCE